METISVFDLAKKITTQKERVEKCKTEGLDLECVLYAELVLMSLEQTLQEMELE